MNYEKLSNDLKINIMSYLDYETIENLGNTNKNNNILYKELKNKNYISLYSTQKFYINKKNKHNLFYKLLFIKIISYNEKYITYKYVKYGKYQNYVYPISSYILYFLTHDITSPSYGNKVIVNKNNFDSEYELYEEYKMYKKNETFKNKYFLSKFILNSILIYLFFYIPIIILLYLFYFFYFLFFIITIMVYIFHIFLIYEILLTFVVTRNIHFIDYI